MLSVIVSSRKPASWDLHRRQVADTIGVRHEYVKIPNPRARLGLAAAYNLGASRASGEILAFVHEDAFFMTRRWGAVLEEKFKADPSVGLIGVAGTRHLFSEDLRWHAAGPPFTRGRVVQESADGSRRLSLYSWDRADSEVVALDGLFLALRRDLFGPGRVRFDEETFGGFHFYDLDLCMQVRRTHRCLVAWDILVRHRSSGRRDRAWSAVMARFKEKYRAGLPATCCGRAPDRRRLAPVRHCGLDGEGRRVLSRLGLLE